MSGNKRMVNFYCLLRYPSGASRHLPFQVEDFLFFSLSKNPKLNKQ